MCWFIMPPEMNSHLKNMDAPDGQKGQHEGTSAVVNLHNASQKQLAARIWKDSLYHVVSRHSLVHLGDNKNSSSESLRNLVRMSMCSTDLKPRGQGVRGGVLGAWCFIGISMHCK